MNRFEQLIEYVINDEEQKARELFHDIVVEKSRQIYENLMAEEAEEARSAGRDPEALDQEAAALRVEESRLRAEVVQAQSALTQATTFLGTTEAELKAEEDTIAAAMRAIADVVTNFDMPGANMPGFGRKAVQIALAGIYDLQQHLDEVIAPVLRAWNVFERTDLSGDGLVAREELAAFIKTAGADAQRFSEKREIHFERLIARGQEPIRIPR